MTDIDVDENNLRLVVRPTQDQYDRIQKLMATRRFKHLSELLRQMINIGLDKLEE